MNPEIMKGLMSVNDSQKRLLLIVRRTENHKPRCDNMFLLAYQ